MICSLFALTILQKKKKTNEDQRVSSTLLEYGEKVTSRFQLGEDEEEKTEGYIFALIYCNQKIFFCLSKSHMAAIELGLRGRDRFDRFDRFDV